MGWKEWQEQGDADWKKMSRVQKIGASATLVFFVGACVAILDFVIPDSSSSYPYKDMESCKKAYQITKNKKINDDLLVELIEKHPEEAMRLATNSTGPEHEKQIRMFLINKQFAVWARNCKERDGFFGPGPKGESP